MRIVHVSDFSLPRLGGIEVHVDALAHRQRLIGHEVDVLAPLGGNGGPLQRARPAVIAQANAVIRDGDYDVVHVHASVFSPLAFGAAASASRSGIPTVVTAHSLLSRLRVPLRGIDLATRWTRWPVAWTAVSEVAAAPLRRLVGTRTTVSVLPNAIDLDAWRVEPVRRDPHRVVVAAVMRLAARKRPLALLRALRVARATVSDRVYMSAVIVGEGQQRASLERYMARHGLHPWVHLTGRLPHDRIADLYGRADLFVAPARLESFGIAALEARAAGLPVIAMQRGAISTFVAHGRNGLLVDNDRDLADAVTALATNPTMRARMAAENRASPPPFGWSEALERVEIEYARAVAVQHTARSGHVGPRRAVAAVKATT